MNNGFYEYLVIINYHKPYRPMLTATYKGYVKIVVFLCTIYHLTIQLQFLFIPSYLIKCSMNRYWCNTKNRNIKIILDRWTFDRYNLYR